MISYDIIWYPVFFDEFIDWNAAPAAPCSWKKVEISSSPAAGAPTNQAFARRLSAWDWPWPTERFGGFKRQEINGHFRNLNWRYLPYKAYGRPIYIREYPRKTWPYMVQYLHFRIRKFPLNKRWFMGFHGRYCGWKKSCSTFDGRNPINNGMFTTYQLVQDFFHPPYHQSLWGCIIYIYTYSNLVGLNVFFQCGKSNNKPIIRR